MPTKFDGQPSQFPIKPEIPESFLVRESWISSDGSYAGPIKAGMVFAWEPDLPHARELVIVDTVGDTSILSLSYPLNAEKIPAPIQQHVNPISKFRQSVVPTSLRSSLTALATLRRLRNPDAEPETNTEKKETPTMDLYSLRKSVAEIWTDAQYSHEFNTEPQPHRHFTHALLHAAKACGKLAEYVDDLDHKSIRKEGGTPVTVLLADLVICAERMAQTLRVSLDTAVTLRLETLKERYTTNPEVSAAFEHSARVLLEETTGLIWAGANAQTKSRYLEIAKNHFLRTAKLNVESAERGQPSVLSLEAEAELSRQGEM